jgi:hypothetical protein
MKRFSTIFTVLLSLGSIYFIWNNDTETALLLMVYAIFHKLDTKD